MENKHTPEPWGVFNGTDVFSELGSVNALGILADKGDGWQVADCYIGKTFVGGELGPGLSPGERYANAAHIVACVNGCAGINPDAVPNLLDALVALVRELDEPLPGGADPSEQYCAVGDVSLKTAAAAAIAKATGDTS